MSDYAALPVLAAATLSLAIGVPLVRSWVQHRTFALMRPRTELQRFLHMAFAGCMVGYGLWATALVTLGPAALGVLAVPLWASALGYTLSAVSLGLVVVAQAQMGRSWRIGLDPQPNELVTAGVFRIARHPIYLGMLGIVLGIAVVAPSAWTVMGVLLVYVVVGFQARAEEEHMVRQHGEAYLAWAGRVGRFVPGIGILRSES